MEYRKDKPESQRNFPVCQNIIYSGIDFNMLEGQINKRSLEKEWKTAKDFEV
jgi:hypothetical protein